MNFSVKAQIFKESHWWAEICHECAYNWCVVGSAFLVCFVSLTVPGARTPRCRAGRPGGPWGWSCRWPRPGSRRRSRSVSAPGPRSSRSPCPGCSLSRRGSSPATHCANPKPNKEKRVSLNLKKPLHRILIWGYSQTLKKLILLIIILGSKPPAAQGTSW